MARSFAAFPIGGLHGTHALTFLILVRMDGFYGLFTLLWGGYLRKPLFVDQPATFLVQLVWSRTTVRVFVVKEMNYP